MQRSSELDHKAIDQSASRLYHSPEEEHWAIFHYYAQGGTMITNDQIEAYLIETGVPFEEVKEGFWLIHNEDDDVDNIVVVHTAPVITFRVKLMDAPVDKPVELYEFLLRLNATSMIAGAFGLEDSAVVIVDSLQSENLDYNEFQASVDAITFAVREHYEELRAFAPVSKTTEEN